MSDDVHQDLADIRARLEVLEQRLDEAAASDRTDEVLRRLDTLQDRLAGGQGSLLDQLQDNLADVASGEVVGSLWEEVRELRTDVGTAGGGLDESARESLDALRAEVEGIGAALAARTEPSADPAVAGIREELRLLADDVRAVVEAPAAPAPSDAEDRLAPLVDELATLRAELTEGLVVEPSDALLDQVAALRDFVGSELDRLQQAVAARPEASSSPATVDTGPLEELAGRLRTELDRLSSIGAAPSAAGMDDDTVELLREEIRAAGGVSDQLVDALRDELKALRRRIAVKASEKVLDEEQLDQIAEAVAARLSGG